MSTDFFDPTPEEQVVVLIVSSQLGGKTDRILRSLQS
jgi:hypothetical protein